MRVVAVRFVAGGAAAAESRTVLRFDAIAFVVEEDILFECDHQRLELVKNIKENISSIDAIMDKNDKALACKGDRLMQLTIDIKESALDKVLYLLENLKDVKIISKIPDIEPNLEAIEEDDPDFAYVKEARKRREKGEKTYDIDEVMKEFE